MVLQSLKDNKYGPNVEKLQKFGIKIVDLPIKKVKSEEHLKENN